MRKTIFILFIAIALSASSLYAQTDNTDTQFWNETSLEFPLDRDNKKLSGVLIGNLRMTDDISEVSDRRIGFAVKYKVTRNLTVKPSYIFRNQGRPGTDRYEHRFRLDITPKKNFNKFSIENRSRFEHRAKTAGRDDDTFYRNRTKIKIPVKKGNETQFTPFFSNGTYFDIQTPRVHRNDSVAGISKKFNDSLAMDFFYQYRRNFQSGTKHINGIGVNFKFKIK